MVLKLNSKNLSTTFLVRKDEEGELLLPVGSRVSGRMPKKKTVRSSITSMGFPLLQKPGEICTGRQIGVPGKFWNFNRGRMSEEEATTLFKSRYSARVSFFAQVGWRWCSLSSNGAPGDGCGWTGNTEPGGSNDDKIFVII
jgi:hypothetical protein